MLQLEPSKRIPLSKVLEHKWMLKDESVEPPMSAPLAHSKCRTASGSVMWNDQVLLAIQRMNCNVESVKQVRPSVDDLSMMIHQACACMASNYGQPVSKKI